ncbi:hypothetical protein [Hoeflea olei]|uniref:Uncharacterized protein n=1 Tax=Hoeflea olei TaxID=1480615 RepID=A0A1C1YXR4_9HYPH|nr:hypothetical protein [Hoeflea olei]OCW58200.1 hypothetical protein AWJ14_01175 [Hoeflea olei]
MTEIEYQVGKTNDLSALNRRTFVSVCSLTNWVSVGLGFYFALSGPVRFIWWLVPVAVTAILINFVALTRFVRYTPDLKARLYAAAAILMSFIIWVGLPAMVILFGFLEARYPHLMHSLSRNRAGGRVGIAVILFLFSPTYLSMLAHRRGSKTSEREPQQQA